MLSELVQIVRGAVRSMLVASAPEQLAGGFTIGMMIGFVPKGSLIALSLCVLLFSMRCNKGIALLAAVSFSFAGNWTYAFAHKLGLATLSIEKLQGLYASVFNLPLGPWIGFDNTVCTGSFLIGLYICYPVYWLTRQFFAAVQSISSGKGHGGQSDQLEISHPTGIAA